ncbi:ATP cone domain-containing protein [Thomasclavelia cocleata]|uniref:ATP cone domain-containing protein n=1 Tax=Thomasclavelia cocleata TaxID=69824 RepID=A0A1I0BGH6_9FIRM|nr:anaerobic ribonucleoside-triphosphate reductase [Thomasclavelia cocleata]MCR1959899.1 ATP cone domain-containing protein [Thomasclavelia cocleata]SET05302.1 ATP cone domain-containing protein [Thomasclavelia cocleata]
MLKVIKRNGNKVDFDSSKIKNAIIKAFKEVDKKITESAKLKAGLIAKEISNTYTEYLSVEAIQDMVEDKLLDTDRRDVAKAYIRYRCKRNVNREISKDLSKRYDNYISLVKGNNEEVIKENSNKDTRIIPTMRDYLAGFTCKEMAEKLLVPKEIIDAHNKGIIHFHDMDYSPGMPMTNCSLINLEDMLQNGTVISGTMIEKPHSFRTACTIATQIIAQVASSQYGGNTISLSHLAPFVDISRKKIKKKVKYEIGIASGNPELIDELTEKRLKEEIADGVQTIQYQLITISSTNGQSPFTSIFMYLGEVSDKQTKNDLAMIIEEVLRQRIKGVKNEKGAPITIAFPKLLYVLEEDNVHENSKYWYLTKLAAECSSKRLVPDYISEKKMRELKQNNCFPCMGKRKL